MDSFTEIQTNTQFGTAENHWFGPTGRQRIDSTGHSVSINAYTSNNNGGNPPWTVTLALSEISSTGTIITAQSDLVTYNTGLDNNFGFDNREIGDDKLIAVWGSAYQNNPNTTSGDITAEFFQDNGTAIGSSKVLLTNIANLQDVRINDGRIYGSGFFLTYSTYDPVAGIEQIAYQRYDIDANAIVGQSGILETRNAVSSYQDYRFSSFPTTDPNSPDYIFADRTALVGGSDHLQFKIFNSDLSKVVESFDVTAGVPAGSTNIQVGAWGSVQLTPSNSSGNNFGMVSAVTYMDASSLQHSVIDVHTFDINTQQGSEYLINLAQTVSAAVDVVALGNGSFVVKYVDSGVPYLQDFGNDGQPVGQPFSLPTDDVKSTMVTLDNNEVFLTSRISSGGQQHFASSIYKDNVACYVQGTRIRSAVGEQPIERLSVGDLLVTLSGQLRPVKWIGRRRINVIKHPDPKALCPVRVTAGAFGDGKPGRDLWLSPGHNVLLGSILVPIRLLINGATVVQVPVDKVTYWHVELDTHDVILAEGLPAESYLDTGNRTAFEGGGVFLDLYPDFEPRHETETCAPIRKAGPEVEAARGSLLNRAQELGHLTTADPDIHVRASGERIEPIALGHKRFAFYVPPGHRHIALVSRTFQPCHTDPRSTDTRMLGVSVKGLRVDGQNVDLQRLAAVGWHDVEIRPKHVQRWTNGAATLPAGACTISVDLAGDGRYWMDRGEIGLGARKTLS